MTRELLYHVEFSKAESQATQGSSLALPNDLSRLLNLPFSTSSVSMILGGA